MNPERFYQGIITLLTIALVIVVLFFLAIMVTGCDIVDFSSLIEVTAEPTPIEEVLPTPTQILERTETEFILVVSQQNTLRGIAFEVYGDESRWVEIFEANKDVIDDPNFIFVGQRLVIPNYNLD